MAFTRDLFKKRNFKTITIEDFDTGGETITIRSLTTSEQESIEKFQPKDDNVSDDVKSAAYKKTMLAMFALAFGDVDGKRIYGDLEDSTLQEIADNVPMFVILRVVKLAQEYNNEQLKKA